MKILIAGHTGMLGTDLVKTFGDGHEIRGVSLPGFDITSIEDCLSLARECRPGLIINAAALTAVDYCESHEEEANLANGYGAANLAAAAASVSAKFVHYSTDYVFDGSKPAPWVETDTPHPLSAYGRSKLLGEFLVRTAWSDFLILRTSWVFGLNGPSFIRTILKAAGNGQPLRVVNDQFGSPTGTVDLARHTRTMVEAGCRGIYHVTNSGSCSWHELAVRVVEWAGLGNEVVPVSTSEFPRPAPRPRNSVLENRRLAREGLPAMPPWEQAVRSFVGDLLSSTRATP
jgi:dTDP-4-dehydrorhamnose reductase